MSKIAERFEWQNFKDSTVRSQFMFITDIGLNAVNNETLLKKVCQIIIYLYIYMIEINKII